MGLFNKNKDLIEGTREIREIKKIHSSGDDYYKVIFITEEQHNVYKNGILINTYKNIVTKESNLLFYRSEPAEIYGKYCVKCDEYIDTYHDIKIFPVGYKDVEKYGFFSIHREYISIYDIIKAPHFEYRDRNLIKFEFNKPYVAKCGTFTYIDQYKLFGGEDILSDIIKECEETDEIIKRFDVNTLESLPINKLKATSEELKRLEELVAEYNNVTEKYMKLLETINKR